jgi:hypothetical protein
MEVKWDDKGSVVLSVVCVDVNAVTWCTCESWVVETSCVRCGCDD